MEIESHEIYKEVGPARRSVILTLYDDQITVNSQNLGSVVEEITGSNEYEFETIVRKNAWGPLAVALIREYMADGGATDTLKEICQKYEVPHQFNIWD